jgi:Sulfotransferase domain
MSLKVVGSGFGRTGTHSLKLALEELGFGPCHHMIEVIENPDQLPFWRQAAAGHLPDWDEVFAGYASCVDWPAARFWREIAAHYPGAKVLHSIRPQDKWFESIHATIYPGLSGWPDAPAGRRRDHMEMAWRIIADQTFGRRLDDRDHALSVYREHTEEVRRTIAPDRLLVFDVAEGWEPLCRFLGVPVPASDFPRSNTTAEFQARMAAINATQNVAAAGRH